MHDDQFRIILTHFGLSWDGYRRVRKGVKKRLNRHMQSCGCHTVGDYIQLLKQNRIVSEACERLLTVSISRFFRDRQLWSFLQYSLLPELFEYRRNKINAWSAGCACGEEVYSMKIVWDKLRKSHAKLPALEITATDMNPAYLENAVTGKYPKSSLKEATPSDVSDYFTKGKGEKRYRVNEFLRDHILWKRLDFRRNAPEEVFNIIFLRNNILTYYEDPLRTDTFNKILDRLVPWGILIIGARESLPESTKTLEPIAPFSYVFRKIS